MNAIKAQPRAVLQSIAHRTMRERCLLPDFSAGLLSELARIQGPMVGDGGPVRDTWRLLWFSIDNDDYLDLGQLTAAVEMPAGLDVGYELRVS